ncbi:hypothetical protein [Haladaptatus sp. DFWS20]|uniref:hypothetical protein n=1 Tax=Haladaptatus sp. DFWS20 TaxID=3403467 RepID=UPI003EBBBC4E
MGKHGTKPTWPQIRDALEVNEDRLLSALLTGSFVTPTKEVSQESDVDVVFAFETDEAIDKFGLVGTLGW